MSTESLLLGLSITCPVVMLWLSQMALARKVNKYFANVQPVKTNTEQPVNPVASLSDTIKVLQQDHQTLSDRFTELSTNVDQVKRKADHAISVINTNAKRYRFATFIH